MAIGLFDEVKVLITDEQQIEELEFAAAQEAFCEASCRWHDSKQQRAMERMTECEVKLLNCFMRGSDQPIMLRAWSAYRRKLLYHHKWEA